MKTFTLIILFSLALSTQIFAQLEPTLPALTFAPDARAAAMADVGTATSADVNSQHWNAAKYVFSNESSGIGLSYTPWLRDVTSDVSITYLSGFYKYNEKESLSASLRFFSLGNIDFYTSNAEFLQRAKPNEFAIDVAYSRKLDKHFSGAVTFRYINSSKVSIQNSIPVIEHESNIAADIAFFYQKPITLSFAEKSELAFGVTISNLGTKVSVSDSINYFLPMCFRLGARITLNFDDKNSLAPTIEFNKSLVPNDYKYANSTTLSAATHGFISDLSKITWALGAEYSYSNQFFVRAGYHHESKSISNNSYITFGLGVKYKTFDFGASYLFTTNSQNTILNNTYRLSVALAFGGNKKNNWYDYDL